MARIIPEEDFQKAMENENLYSIAMLINQSKQYIPYTLSHDQIDTLLKIPYSNLASKKPAVRILVEMYVEQTVSFTDEQAEELFRQYCLYYPRAKGGYTDKFFTMVKERLDLDNISLETGKAWVKSYLQSREKEFDLEGALASWAGVVCDSKSDKYIFAGIWYEDENKEIITFRTFYGKIENTPQTNTKMWPVSHLTDAIDYFDKYVREKRSHGYSDVKFAPAPKKEEIKEIQKEEEEKAKEQFSGLSWDDLYKKIVPLTGIPSSMLGSIMKAVAFCEYRARSRGDFPSIYSTPEELESSLLSEALGFLYTKFRGIILDCLRSKNKEEWLTSIGILKKIISSLDAEKFLDLYTEKGEEFVQDKYGNEFKKALELAKKSN